MDGKWKVLAVLSYCTKTKWVLDKSTVSSLTISREALLAIASVSCVTLTLSGPGIATGSGSTGGNEQTRGVVTITLPVLGRATETVALILDVRSFGVDTLLHCRLGADGTHFIVDIPVAGSSLC